jgi:hypothetical protein
MSQSDYIRHKKLARVMKDTTELSPVLASQEYTAYKEYSLETTIQNHKELYYRFTPEGTQSIFGMYINNAPNCITYPFCRGTDSRNNRVLNSENGVYYQPKPMRPIPLKTIKQTQPEKVSIQNNVHCQCAFV